MSIPLANEGTQFFSYPNLFQFYCESRTSPSEVFVKLLLSNDIWHISAWHRTTDIHAFADAGSIALDSAL